jgi:hypothetical protein
LPPLLHTAPTPLHCSHSSTLHPLLYTAPTPPLSSHSHHHNSSAARAVIMSLLY